MGGSMSWKWPDSKPADQALAIYLRARQPEKSASRAFIFVRFVAFFFVFQNHDCKNEIRTCRVRSLRTARPAFSSLGMQGRNELLSLFECPPPSLQARWHRTHGSS